MSEKPTTISKGRYSIFQTPEGDGVVVYRPDGEKEDQRQVVPAKFWKIITGVLSGEVTSLSPMDLMKTLMGK